MVNDEVGRKTEHIMSTRSSKSERRRSKWIGLAHVKARPGNNALNDAAGAVVPSLALASGPKDFAAKVTATLDACGFDVVEIEDIETLQERLRKYRVTASVLKLAKGLKRDKPVVFGTFHAYRGSPIDRKSESG